MYILSIACSTGDIRLEGGSTPYEGRVEVCRDQTWGTVCDNQWNDQDARVVCRHLEFSGIGRLICDLKNIYLAISYVTGAQAIQGARYGQGYGPIYLDNVACVGNEVDIFDCPAITIHDCDHSQDASVICNYPREYNNYYKPPLASWCLYVCILFAAVCVENELRLVGGLKESEGRVEICRTEEWNTICDRMWSNEEATVICKELGYSRYSKYSHKYFAYK